MSMLGERFPQAQFLVTGVMGPGSNAHGPNEFIDLPTGVKVTASVAEVLADHGKSLASPEMKALHADGALFIGRIQSYLVEEKTII